MLRRLAQLSLQQATRNGRRTSSVGRELAKVHAEARRLEHEASMRSGVEIELLRDHREPSSGSPKNARIFAAGPEGGNWRGRMLTWLQEHRRWRTCGSNSMVTVVDPTGAPPELRLRAVAQMPAVCVFAGPNLQPQTTLEAVLARDVAIVKHERWDLPAGVMNRPVDAYVEHRAARDEDHIALAAAEAVAQMFAGNFDAEALAAEPREIGDRQESTPLDCIVELGDYSSRVLLGGPARSMPNTELLERMHASASQRESAVIVGTILRDSAAWHLRLAMITAIARIPNYGMRAIVGMEPRYTHRKTTEAFLNWTPARLIIPSNRSPPIDAQYKEAMRCQADEYNGVRPTEAWKA